MTTRISRSFLAFLALGLLAVTFALARLQPIYWGDLWWHLGVGEYIVTHHRIPTTDIFSWTVAGAAWTNTEWLFEVVLFGFLRVLGLAGVMLFKTLLMGVSLYFMDRRLRLWKASVFERLAFLGLAFMAAWPFWVERADLTSLALLSALLFAIDKGNIHVLWVFLFALWPNLHGAFIIGLFALGLKTLLEFPRRPASRRQWIFWTAFCVTATLANPYGIKLFFGIFKNMSGPLDQVSEWLPPSGLGYLFFFISLGVSVVSLALKKKWNEEDLYAACILLTFAGYALLHARFVHFFAVCAFPYAARQWLTSPWRQPLADRVAHWEKAALAVCATSLFLTSISAAQRVQGGVDQANSGYIKKACEFIATENIQGPFYNDYKFGSYWIWHFKGNPPVFQDGRHATVAGYDRLIDATLEAQSSPATWNAYADRLGVQAALVRYPPPSHEIRPAPFDRYFPRSSWALIYWDDLCVLFVRRTPQNAALLNRWEYRALKPDWTLESYRDQLRLGKLDRKAARRELDKNLALNPDCRRAQAGLYWLDHAIQ